MARRRRQLERGEAALARWWLGGALAVLAGAAAFALDTAARLLLGVLCAAAAAVSCRPQLAEWWSGAWRRAILPTVAAMLALDWFAGSRPFPAGARVVMLLLLFRTVTVRGAGGERQLAGLGLLLVMMGGVAAESVWFALHLAAYVPAALLLFYFRCQDGPGGAAPERVRIRRWWRMVLREDWRMWLPGVIFFAVIAAGGTLVFLAAPRPPAGNFPVMERLFSPEKSGIGFSDTLRLDGVEAIQADDSVAFRVDLGRDGAAAAARGGPLYWRMIVLDEYRNRTFRLSAALRATAFSARVTLRKIGGAADAPRNDNDGAWTFFMEPGAGNHLPLPENFSEIVFSKPIKGRVSESLGVVDLGNAPRRLVAYRANVGHMNAESGLRDAELKTSAGNPFLGTRDRAALADAVNEIRGGRAMGAEEFARAASAWLGARHAYSLSPEMPRGDGRGAEDPLVLWALSREPGHCELFAGALVLLAREAGYEARVVAGFSGGELNGNYLLVRNARAHAWCEVRDANAAAWARVDPTLSAGGAAGDARAAQSNVVTMRSGPGALVDRWRLAWHRYAADFDEPSQGGAWAKLQDIAANARDTTRETALAIARACAERPWRVAAALALVAGAAAWWLRRGKAVFMSWRLRRSDGEAWARREAGIWLRRIGWPGGGEAGALLLRVRYGRRESWPELEEIWRKAKRARRERNGCDCDR